MNKILLVQFTIGPTYKARLLANLQNYSSYDRFDVFIMTDDVDYFNSISNRSNITIKDINEIRKDYPWSLELEKIPPKIDNEAEYVKYFLENNVKIPTLLRRFVFTWDKAINYEGFIFMDCDILPVADDHSYAALEKYFCNPVSSVKLFQLENLEDKILIVPGGGRYDEYHHSFLKDFAIAINEKYKVTDREIVHNFIKTDGNFRSLKFPNKEAIKTFFELLNNVVHDILTDDKFFVLGVHTMWNLHSEYILSILFNLLNAEAFPLNHELGIPQDAFIIGCFPEDRFWNWGLDTEPSAIGKMDFVEKNYDKLKQFYENRGQVWPYIK